MKPKRYLRNLYRALIGKDPYKVELDDVAHCFEWSEKKIQSLRRLEHELTARSEKAERQVRSFQTLTENLRQSIMDKEECIAAMKRDCEERLRDERRRYENAVATMRKQHQCQRDELEQKNYELQSSLDDALQKLRDVKEDIGREMVNTNLLEKSISAESDLLNAMKSENVEKMKIAAAYPGWNNTLSHMARLHLDALVKKKDLEETLKETLREINPT